MSQMKTTGPGTASTGPSGMHTNTHTHTLIHTHTRLPPTSFYLYHFLRITLFTLLRPIIDFDCLNLYFSTSDRAQHGRGAGPNSCRLLRGSRPYPRHLCHPFHRCLAVLCLAMPGCAVLCCDCPHVLILSKKEFFACTSPI